MHTHKRLGKKMKRASSQTHNQTRGRNQIYPCHSTSILPSTILHFTLSIWQWIPQRDSFFIVPQLENRSDRKRFSQAETLNVAQHKKNRSDQKMDYKGFIILCWSDFETSERWHDGFCFHKLQLVIALPG